LFTVVKGTRTPYVAGTGLVRLAPQPFNSATRPPAKKPYGPDAVLSVGQRRTDFVVNAVRVGIIG
jgi:hypothetical protein